MTDIERLAREAGLPTGEAWGFMPQIAVFAALVAEECAKIADEADMRGEPPEVAIRAMFPACPTEVKP